VGLFYKRALFDLRFVHKVKRQIKPFLLQFVSFIVSPYRHMKFKDIDTIKVAISGGTSVNQPIRIETVTVLENSTK
jgi:hypothetical protein